MNIEDCEGCIDNRPNNGIYSGIPDCNKKGLKEPCPCKICLIKVMCSDACEEFVNYARKNKEEINNMNRYP